MNFTYEEFSTRNMGFVTALEQEKLRDATVFICGTGGMGGATIMALARAGIGHLIIADLDEFEISNLNRQVFCNLNTVGAHKAEATRDACLNINPQMQVDVFHADWPEHVEKLVAQAQVVVNGTDDLSASLLLYRTARKAGKPVIDAYASPLPSVYVTNPSDPMPEQRLNYPTIRTDWDKLSDEQRSEAFLREAEYVILNSSSRHHVDLDLAGEVAAGTRSRMSFAPMVITTGMLMTYEILAKVLGKPTKTTEKGWFFNPYTAKVEHARNPIISAIMRPIVSRFLRKMMTGDAS